MNTIFVDFCNTVNKDKAVSLKNNKYFKYRINDDILNNKIKKITHVSIQKEYIENQLTKTKYSLQDRIFKLNINRKYGKNDEVNLVFSKEIEENKQIKEYVLDLLKLNKLTIYDEIRIKNDLKKKDMLYIDKYMKLSKKSIDKLKILVVIDKIEDYDQSKILEYISNYKFVDILVTNNITKIDTKRIEKYVSKINNEYGTTIDVLKKRNVQKYDVYLIYSNIKKQEFFQKYIIGNKSLYINMTDIDYDILSKEYDSYKRYEPEIITLFNRLDLNIENFSKVKLGFLFK